MLDKKNNSSGFKVIIVGDSGIGKTCLGYRLTGSDYDPDHHPTVSATTWTVTVEKDDSSFKFDVWDTAGSEQYRSITKTYFRNSHLVLLCYSVDFRSSFENLQEWKDAVDDELPGVPIVLVGTKGDLYKDDPNFVSEAEGRAKAEGMKTVHVITSAQSGKGIEDLKEEFVRIVNSPALIEADRTVSINVQIVNTSHECC
jgi:small GTP-binding protein